MEFKELLEWMIGVLAVVFYLIYIILKRKEIKEEETEKDKIDKLIWALKEYSNINPELAKIFNKFGIL
ncbi:MAG: hypothetical protein AB1298_00775 [Bacteroidota bacterium]